MKRTLIPLTLILSGAVIIAAADTLPTRKAGLWETTMTGGSLADSGPSTVKQCVDAATDRAALTGGMAAKMCQQGPVVKTAAGYEVQSTCQMGPVKTSAKSIMSGDFNSKITVNVTSMISNGDGPPKESKMLIESRYVGACQAGQKPGDVIMPDGKIIHMTPPGGAAQ